MDHEHQRAPAARSVTNEHTTAADHPTPGTGRYVSQVRAGNDPPSAKRLGALLALAEAGTVAAAAAAVGISQSTASNLLLALEGDIGSPVYERGHRGTPANITPVGQQLCRLAELAGLSSTRPPLTLRGTGRVSGRARAGSWVGIARWSLAVP
ncbi:MAG TPA: LysR family transcriptional regulator [Marmoricola sp.]|nr:LysR family transcriptional regulator [Marmoricola sp.]